MLTTAEEAADAAAPPSSRGGCGHFVFGSSASFAAPSSSSYSTMPSSWDALRTALLVSYLLVELCFYAAYKWYLVPRANRRRTRPPSQIAPYRDYGRNRHLLLMRIMERMERTCRMQNRCLRKEIRSFLLQWFRRTDDNNNNNNNNINNINININNDGTTTTAAKNTDENVGEASAAAAAMAETETSSLSSNDSVAAVAAAAGRGTTSAPATRRRRKGGGSDGCYDEHDDVAGIDVGDADDDDDVNNMCFPILSLRNHARRRVGSSCGGAAAASGAIRRQQRAFAAGAASTTATTASLSTTATQSLPTTNGQRRCSPRVLSPSSCLPILASKSNSNDGDSDNLDDDFVDVDDEYRDDADDKGNSNKGHQQQHDHHTDDDDEDDDNRDEYWTVEGLDRAVVDPFFAWAFFGKPYEDLLDWELAELELCYHEIERRQKLVFPRRRNSPSRCEKGGDKQKESRSSVSLEPRRLSLEDVQPIHRPLLVYVSIALLKFVALRVVLTYLCGFQRVVSSGGRGGKKGKVVAWYRPSSAKQTKSSNHDKGEEEMPLLFFHGIAPGGLVFYLPMVCCSLARDGQRCLLFENSNISCTLGFDALTEEETVDGVLELVDRYLPPNADLSLVGHSFGSCPLTWLLHAPSLKFRNRIRQFVLMDPVTLLLSEPDVMNNFVYSQDMSKIRIMAASELFTEYYLRRHFSWYNSELWLDDLYPSHEGDCDGDDAAAAHDSDFNSRRPIQLLVALSGQDEIVNSSKVRHELELFGRTHRRARTNMRVLYWDGVGHASCVTSPRKWNQLAELLRQQQHHGGSAVLIEEKAKVE